MRSYNPALFERAAQRALVDAVKASKETSLIGILADLVESFGPTEKYPYISQAPYMAELTDSLVVTPLSNALYSVTNKTYSASFAVKRDDLKDDQVGGFMQRVKDISTIAANFPNKLMLDALIAGTSGLGFDGVAFYSDTHPNRGSSGVQDNLLAGTGVSASALQTDISSGIAAIARMLGENGQPLQEDHTAFVAVIPPALRGAFNTAAFGDIISQTSNKSFEGMTIRPVVSARLTDVNDWYLAAVDVAKPLIIQEARKLDVETLAEGSDRWVEKEEMLVKVSWRGACAYGHFGYSVKFVN